MSLLPAGKSAISHIQAHLEEARAPVPREAAPAAAPAAEPAANPAEPSGAAAPAAESAVDSAEPSGAALPAAEAEADPFNLDAIMEPPAPRRAAAPVLARLACPVVARWGTCGVGFWKVMPQCLYVWLWLFWKRTAPADSARKLLMGILCDKAELNLSWAEADERQCQVLLHHLTSALPACRPAPDPAPAPPDSGAGALRIRESGALKREALLDCLDTARGCYAHAWARTSVDLAIEVGAFAHVACGGLMTWAPLHLWPDTHKRQQLHQWYTWQCNDAVGLYSPAWACTAVVLAISGARPPKGSP